MKFFSFENFYYIFVSILIANLVQSDNPWGHFTGIVLCAYGMFMINGRVMYLTKLLEKEEFSKACINGDPILINKQVFRCRKES